VEVRSRTRGDSNPRVDTEWRSELVAEELTDGVPRDSSDEFTDEVTEGERVICVAFTGCPQRFLFEERVEHG
jgi:hypothetical protein